MTLTEERPCEDAVSRRPSVSQGDRPQEELTPLPPGSWTCSLQNWETIRAYCLSPPVCGTSFWQPELAHRPRLTVEKVARPLAHLTSFKLP